MSNYIRVRIRESGQIVDMIPSVATAMISGGTAERVADKKPWPGETKAPIGETKTIENGMAEPRAETAVAPQQRGPFKKLRNR